MFRVTLGLATATLFALAAASPASAGPCCGSNWGWGAGWGVNSWGSNCCNRGYAYQQAPVFYQQPQYQYYVQPAAPIVVQAPPQQIIVQQPQPEVIFQQAYAPVPTYTVNHGPHYAGPEVIGYPRTQYYADEPVRAYPYVNGYHKPRYYGRPYYRSWKYGYRSHRHYGVYKSYRPYRHAAYHHRMRVYKDAPMPHVHVGPKKKPWH